MKKSSHIDNSFCNKEINALLDFVDSYYNEYQYQFGNDGIPEDAYNLANRIISQFSGFDIINWRSCLKSVLALIEEEISIHSQTFIREIKSNNWNRTIDEILDNVDQHPEINTFENHNTNRYFTVINEPNDIEDYEIYMATEFKNHGIEVELFETQAGWLFEFNLTSEFKFIKTRLVNELEKGLQYCIELLIRNIKCLDRETNKYQLNESHLYYLKSLNTLVNGLNFPNNYKQFDPVLINQSYEHLQMGIDIARENPELEINTDMALAETQAHTDRASGGDARSELYEDARKLTLEILQRQKHKFRTNGQAAKYIHEKLLSWSKDQIANGRPKAEFRIYSESHLQQVIIPSLLETHNIKIKDNPLKF